MQGCSPKCLSSYIYIFYIFVYNFLHTLSFLKRLYRFCFHLKFAIQYHSVWNGYPFYAVSYTQNPSDMNLAMATGDLGYRFSLLCTVTGDHTSWSAVGSQCWCTVTGTARSPSPRFSLNSMGVRSFLSCSASSKCRCASGVCPWPAPSPCIPSPGTSAQLPQFGLHPHADDF